LKGIRNERSGDPGDFVIADITKVSQSILASFEGLRSENASQRDRISELAIVLKCLHQHIVGDDGSLDPMTVGRTMISNVEIVVLKRCSNVSAFLNEKLL
jgi:hypothetical protein